MVEKIHIEQAIRKAMRTVDCKYHVAAIAYDKRGNFLGITVNKPRFDRPRGNMHAEIQTLIRYGNRVRVCIILRTNSHGGLLDIHPCKNCTESLRECGVVLYTYTPSFELKRIF
jgi:hypothetical protein